MPTPPIAWYADKDQGPRADNQDNVLVTDQNDTARRNAKGVLLILCDGVGGEKGGQRASSLATEAAFNAYYSESGPPQQTLRSAIEKANQTVRAAAAADQSIKNMATTIVAMAVIDDKLYVSHVGDSRGYLLRDGVLTRLTKDHSWVAEQVERGLLTPQEARVSNQRNIITRSLGAAANHTPDINADPITLQPGDRIMICSDGLHGAVTDEQITAIMQQNPSPQKAVTTLIKAANDNHTTDNISSIVFNYGVVAAAAAKGSPIPLIGAIAGILVVLAAAVLVISAMSTNNNQNPTTNPTATATQRATRAANGTSAGADIPEAVGTVTDTTATPEGTLGPATVTPDLRNSPTPKPIIPTIMPSATPTLQPTIGPTQAPTDTPKPNQPKPADTPKPANTSAPTSAPPTNTPQPPPTNTPQPPPTNTPQPPPTDTPQPPPEPTHSQPPSPTP
ncbi:MAG: protein phosphatase 2C domain-containing protein [Chloroflexi bacterium]|nr:protein phosphatase 2C domain-containing protein [Chloroflexota bacterium]MCL5275592.1 protein phosphatase 2C domain-containing protein [Chloroflexota bacterium]